MNSEDTTKAETIFCLKCRVCLQQGSIQIFSQHTSDLPQQLRIFGDIEISENDKYPKCLCKHCLNSLKAAIDFRNTAQKTQSILRELEQSSNKNVAQIYAEEEFEILNTLDTLDGLSPQSSDEENVHLSFKEENVNSWNDFEGNSQLDKLVSEGVNQICNKHNTENGINETEVQIMVDETPFSVEYANSWKEEIDSHSLKVSLEQPQSLNKNLNHTCKDKEIKFSTTLNIQQDSQCMDKNINKVQNKIRKTSNRARAKTKQFSDETLTQSCGEEDIKHLKVSEVTAHCDRYFKAIQVGDVLKYQCNICQKTILRKHSRTLHLVAHLPLSEYTYVCEVCGKKFVRNGDLQQHLKGHYVNRIYVCDMCPYKGHTKDLLKCHMRVHSDQFKYSCTFCPKKFKSNGNLHVHMRRHGKPMFRCETCQKLFYENASLKKHVESQHLGIKKLNKCDQCGKVYFQRRKMLQHQIKVHKREKMFTRAHYLKTELNLN